MANVTAYVDGLNLYHGMVDSDLERYRWLDVESVCRLACQMFGSVTGDSWKLQTVRYFTSPVGPIKGKAAGQRQRGYLGALTAHSADLTFQKGVYKDRTSDCHECGKPVSFKREKRTDVQIAVSMIIDADTTECERLLLLTGDSDLVPAVKSIISRTGKLVGVIAPPNRHSGDLNHSASCYKHLKAAYFNGSLTLPNPVTLGTGLLAHAPAGWLPAHLA